MPFQKFFCDRGFTQRFAKKFFVSPPDVVAVSGM
jgi:hypothetical protein